MAGFIQMTVQREIESFAVFGFPDETELESVKDIGKSLGENLVKMGNK